MLILRLVSETSDLFIIAKGDRDYGNHPQGIDVPLGDVAWTGDLVDKVDDNE